MYRRKKIIHDNLLALASYLLAGGSVFAPGLLKMSQTVWAALLREDYHTAVQKLRDIQTVLNLRGIEYDIGGLIEAAEELHELTRN